MNPYFIHFSQIWKHQIKQQRERRKHAKGMREKRTMSAVPVGAQQCPPHQWRSAEMHWLREVGGQKNRCAVDPLPGPPDHPWLLRGREGWGEKGRAQLIRESFLLLTPHLPSSPREVDNHRIGTSSRRRWGGGETHLASVPPTSLDEPECSCLISPKQSPGVEPSFRSTTSLRRWVIKTSTLTFNVRELLNRWAAMRKLRLHSAAWG